MTTTDGKQKKKSHEAVLRRRARKRAEYVADLEQRGIANKLDPERWLPKYERSANRRRRNRGAVGGAHKGAQGGVSEKDAAKLDIAARQAARAAGETDTGGPSTAHMTVTAAGNIGGGRKGGRRR